ncbi:hypothetical protein HWV62_39794 [Athelia sp. TMB]|nr:hypothetical protein HWV62_39794 [Athelia sp. TMB]
MKGKDKIGHGENPGRERTAHEIQIRGHPSSGTGGAQITLSADTHVGRTVMPFSPLTEGMLDEMADIATLKQLAKTSDKEVAKLKALLKGAKANAQGHRLNLHLALNDLSKAASMPFEILALIFKKGVLQERGLVAEPAQDFAGTVAQVCSRWRQVAVNAPDLWVVVWYDGRGGERGQEKIMTRLKRSGELRLDIRIVRVLDGHLAWGFLKKLSKTMVRCRALQILDFGESEKELLKVVTTLCAVMAPQLEFLTIQGMAVDLWKDALFQGKAPLLATADLLGFDGQQMAFCGPCLSGVTHLRLADVNLGLASHYAGFVQVLQSMPAVAHLEVDPTWTDVPHSTLPTITLPSLRFLLLGVVDDVFCLFAVLGTMLAPSLDTLVLRGWASSDVTPTDISLQHNAFPMLRRLVLQRNISAMLAASAWFGASFPKISHLVLMAGWKDHETLHIGMVFDLLVYRASEGWQELESIALSSRSQDGLKLNRRLKAIVAALKAGRAQVPLVKLGLAASEIAITSVETMESLEDVLDVAVFEADLPLSVRERGLGQ